MPTRVSDSTLEQFRDAAAGRQPTPAGVAVAAVSAAFALGLIAKVHTISGRRKELHAEAARLEALAAAAQAASRRMLQLAGEDTAAFEAYLAARRLPQSTDSERQARDQGMDGAARRAIDLPLAAAQEAAAGLQLCAGLADLTPRALIADLGVAATLLASALRCFLLCAQSNVRQLAQDAAACREQAATAAKQHESALRQAEALLERVRTALESAAVQASEP